MKRSLRFIVSVGASSAIIGALASVPAGAGERAPVERTGVARSATPVTLLAGGSHGAPTHVEPSRAAPSRAAAATFRVTYNGFTPAARAAFQSAVNVWASRVTSTVPITVRATFQPLGANVLGSAGPTAVWRDFPGAPQPGTFYVDAIANKRAGAQLDPSPDIVANFNSTFTNWHFGTTGGTPAGKYDFKTVVLHELGHGLGFLGAGNVSAGRGTVRLGPPNAPAFPTSYDRFTENAAGTKLLSFPNNSTQLATQLRSNNVFFDSPQVRTANGGRPAKLYAPSTWQPGSSYSHLDEATYRQGNANSLMTPILNSAEAIHTPGPITQALFRSIGW
jgi:hypothetical protein